MKVDTVSKRLYLDWRLRRVTDHHQAAKDKAGGMDNGSSWDADLEGLEIDFKTFSDKATSTVMNNEDVGNHLPELRKSLWKDL